MLLHIFLLQFQSEIIHVPPFTLLARLSRHVFVYNSTIKKGGRQMDFPLKCIQNTDKLWVCPFQPDPVQPLQANADCCGAFQVSLKILKMLSACFVKNWVGVSFVLKVLHQNFMRSYIFRVKQHRNVVTFTCCTAHPDAANTHFRTQSEMKQTITLKWAWWWDTMTVPGEGGKKKSVLLISHLWYERHCNSSWLSDGQPDSWEVLASCGHQLHASL